MRVFLEGQACLVPDVLSAEACAAFIADAERRGMGEAPITTDRGFVRRPDVRNNDRAMYDDPEVAERLWAALEPHLPVSMLAVRHQGLRYRAIGLNERLRVYRYGPGQVFRWHRDGYFRRSPEELSMMTVLFYLSAVERGGETVFALGPEAVTPEPGLVLLFDHHLMHQGNEVEAGSKYVLRSDLMFRLRT